MGAYLSALLGNRLLPGLDVHPQPLSDPKFPVRGTVWHGKLEPAIRADEGDQPFFCGIAIGWAQTIQSIIKEADLNWLVF